MLRWELESGPAIQRHTRTAFLTLDMYWTRYQLLNVDTFDEYTPPEPTLPRGSRQHTEWIRACTGQGTTMSNIDNSSQLVKALRVGNVALRVGQTLDWDAANLRAAGCPVADALIRPRYRKDWAL
ncbi:MAG: hypothetical protein ABGZ17_18720 [Planctomycetaceae bacterium]